MNPMETTRRPTRETVRSRYRGRAVGTVQSGWSIGWGISVLAFTVVFARLPHEVAWRVMFWIDILPALFIVYIRRNVEEPKNLPRRIPGAQQWHSSNIFLAPYADHAFCRVAGLGRARRLPRSHHIASALSHRIARHHDPQFRELPLCCHWRRISRLSRRRASH
jgi:MFS family permease